MRALTHSSFPPPDFSLTASPVDLRVSESRVALMTLSRQGAASWHGSDSVQQGTLESKGNYVAHDPVEPTNKF